MPPTAEHPLRTFNPPPADRPPPAAATILGARLRRLRMAQGWSVRQLAEKAGVGKNTVVRIEQGQGGGLKTLGLLCEAFGMDLPTLLMTQPKADTMVSVHEREEEVWQVHSFAERETPPAPELADPRHRLELSREGAKIFLTALNCQLPDGKLNAWVMELHGERAGSSHDGEELVFCLRGTTVLKVAGVEKVLHEGDAATFWSSEVHTYAPAPGQEGPSLILSVWVPA